MPRLFTGLEIPPDIATELSMLRGGLTGARWIDVENYHLTLRFIGDIDERTAGDVFSALERVRRPRSASPSMASRRSGRQAARDCRQGQARAAACRIAGRARAADAPDRHPARATEIRAACHAGAAARGVLDGGRRLSRRARLFPGPHASRSCVSCSSRRGPQRAEGHTWSRRPIRLADRLREWPRNHGFARFGPFQGRTPLRSFKRCLEAARSRGRSGYLSPPAPRGVRAGRVTFLRAALSRCRSNPAPALRFCAARCGTRSVLRALGLRAIMHSGR